MKTNTDFNQYLILNLSDYSIILKQKFLDCRQELSEANVHDLRVSMRRLMAFTSLINNVYADYYSKSVYKELKKFLKILNPLRDIQVQLLAIEEMLDTAVHLYSFHQHLKRTESELIEQIKTSLTDSFLNTIEGLILFIRVDIKNKMRLRNFNIEDFFETTNNAYEFMIGRGKEINPDQIDSIHRFRVSFKKYRYTLEVIKPFSGVTNKTMRKMKRFQDILGDIQDNNVQYQLLDNFIKSVDLPSAQLYSPFIATILYKRRKMINTLMSKLNTLDQLQFKLPS